MSGPTLFNEDGEPLFTPERPGIVVLGDLLEYIQEMRNLYTDTQELYQVLQQNLSFIGSGSPKGVYATLAALQAAKPTGDSSIYVTTDNGNWYYWNGTTWTSGGVYQATGIEESMRQEIIDILIDTAKLNWKTPVNTFSDISLSYSSPQISDTVMVRDTGKIYRFDGTSWHEIQDIDPTAFNELDSRITSELTGKTQDIRATQSNPTNYNGAIVTIIDDDARPDFRTVWQPVLDANPDVKIGIAVVKDWTLDGTSLSLSELLTLQDAGHDILCHTTHHVPSYEITPEAANVDYPEATAWMRQNGLNGYEHLVYPGGLNPNAINIKNIARKYFRYAVSTETAGDYATTPVDNWCIPRINGDAKTLTQLKAAVDYAKTNGIWLILMTHSHILGSTGSQKMSDFIAYVKGQNVPIMSYKEAIQYKGNAVALGEYTDSKNSVFIGVDGKQRQRLNVIKEGSMTDLITTYPVNSLSKVTVNYLQDTLTGKGGVMEVFRGHNDSYSYALFTPNATNRIYQRKWDATNNIWKTWELVSSFEVKPLAVGATMNDGITTFALNAVTVTAIDYLQDTFKNTGGVLTTYRINNDSYGYQEFKMVNSDKKYTRRWASGAWQAWTAVGSQEINVVNNGAILLEPITYFLNNVVTITPCATNANAPEAKGGVYHVYSFADSSYSYAEYKIWNSNVMYRRRWASGAWQAWEKVSVV